MVMDKGNGQKTIEDMAEQKAFEGATIPLDTFRRRDGQFAEALDEAMQQKLGILQRMITAVNKDEDYRQILKLVPWKSTEEQDKYTAALDCCYRTGAAKTFRAILDRLTARTAGLNGWLVHEIGEYLTHTTFTSQKIEGKRRHERNNSSPISR